MSAQTQPKKKTTFVQFMTDFTMGGVAGSIAKTVCAPIERVKLLIQTQHTNPKLAARPYTGIINCFSRVWQEEGVIAYWRGNWANIVRYFPTTAINFSVKDSLQRTFVKGDPQKDKAKYFVGNLLAGGIAGSISLLFVYPLDFARTRMGADVGRALHERQFKSLTHCCTSIYKTDGATGLYKGFGISVLGIFVYRALYFGGYDTGKRWIFGDDASLKKAPFLLKFCFAQCVTTCSETIAFPIDTIRRRLMMQSGREYAAKLEQLRLEKLEKENPEAFKEAKAKVGGSNSEFVVKYKGTADCYRKIMVEEGFKGFF